jgi:hypothetical protein
MRRKSVASLAVIAAVAFLLGGCSSDGTAASVAGTQWNGVDEYGYKLEFHFDRGGSLMVYDMATGDWTTRADEQMTWTQNGASIVITTIDGGTASGKATSSTLTLTNDDGPPVPLTLTKVEGPDDVISGSEWAGKFVLLEDASSAPDVTFYFDPNGEYREHRMWPDRDSSWHLTNEVVSQTWGVEGNVVTLTYTLLEYDESYDWVGTVEGDTMTIVTTGDPVNTVAELTRVD